MLIYSIQMLAACAAVPVFLLATLLVQYRSTPGRLALNLACGLFALGLIYQCLPWAIPGLAWRPLALGLFVVAGLAVAGVRRRALCAYTGRARWRALLPALAVPGALALALWLGADRGSGGLPPALELRSPLPGARVFVMQGGNTALLNVHHGVRAQRWALDLVALNDQRRRTAALWPFWPDALGAYQVYGMAVVAPCFGTVLAVGKGRPQQRIGAMDETAPAGNFVALYCNGATLLLAHLQANPVLAAGELLGRAGNSGRSTEPHLHIHAVRGRVGDEKTLLYDGEPVPLRVQGRFPKRNDVLAPERMPRAAAALVEGVPGA